jgi:predicted nucleic acid-binding protein
MEGTVTLLLSREILAEYNEVLRRKKFSFAETDIANIINTLMIGCVIIEPESTGETIADAKDLPFYEMLMDSRCKGAFLITGNTKHFPQNFYIVTPRQMLDIILQQ